jgi:hypothetical protein
LTKSRQINQRMWSACAVAALTLTFLTVTSSDGRAAPTFTRDVAPILFKSCANCHRLGEIGANISLLTYEGTKPWAEAIKEQVAKRKMPPWPADPNGSLKFRNDPRLSEKEIETIVAWVNAGAPKGNDKDLPKEPTFPQDWSNADGRPPDEVISLPEFTVPATGEIPYLKQMVKVPFPADKWVVAMQLRPGNRALVHHMAVTELALDDGVTPADLDKLATVARQLGLPNVSVAARPAVSDPANPVMYDMLSVYTPGTTAEVYENGSAKLLKGGRNFYLNFNIHYQTTGKPEKDQSKLAFWFEPEPPKHQLFRVPASGETIIASGKQLLTDAPGERAEGTDVAIPPIPAYAENYELIGVTGYPEPVTIYQFQPHAHLRGKDFKYAIVYPDGSEVTALSVPHYDFHWQLAYELETPLHLPAGSKLVITAHYDNSQKNEQLMHHHGHSDSSTAPPPGPEKEIHFREQNQSWDEMFSPFIQYTIDNDDPGKSGSAESSPEKQRTLNVLDVVEAVGCLEQSGDKAWMLRKGSDPVLTKTQSTSMAELKLAAAKPLGKEDYQLLGAETFAPTNHKGQKMEAKGIVIKDASGMRLNVTSLQAVGAICQ